MLFVDSAYKTTAVLTLVLYVGILTYFGNYFFHKKK